MKFLAGQSNTNAVVNLISGNDPIKCAVAFWGLNAIDLLKDSKQKIMIICNLESGATNPEAISQLIKKKNVIVKSFSKLHAKVYLTPSSAIIGSANCSSNGLSYEGVELDGWLEAGIYTSDINVITAAHKWFDDLWANLQPVDEKDILAARILWSKRRTFRKAIVLNNDVSIIDAFRESPESFKDKRIFFVIYAEDASKLDVKAFEREVKKGLPEIPGNKYDFYVDWPEIPTDAFLISFKYDPKRKTKPSGFMISKTMEQHVFRKGHKGSKLLFCKIVNDIDGFKLPKDKSFLKLIASALWEKGVGDGDGRIIDIYETKSILLS